MFSNFQQTLTFDDVLLVPQHSSVLPRDVSLTTYLTKEIKLNTPFLSAPMDTVTEHKMAIALALAGGIGIIHKNLTIDEQVKEVKMVKRFESGFVEEPVTICQDKKISDVYEIKKKHGYKKIPVVDNQGVLVGLISETDYFVPEDLAENVGKMMVPIKNLIVAKQGIALAEANIMIREHRLKNLCVVNSAGKLVSMVSRRDIEKNTLYPNACKNHNKQLRVGAAVGIGQETNERVECLIGVGTDIITIDSAHGHSDGVINTLKELRHKYPNQQFVIGNIVTAEAALALADAGANAVKVGIGPGSICTTRIIAGIGVPQLSAIIEVATALKKHPEYNVKVIADGGIKTSGDVVKALAAGANAVMMGNLFSGTDETPGRVEFLEGKMYKVYRGMGSLEAMERGGKDRYLQSHITEKKKFVPEGVSGRVAYKGPVERIIYQLTGGLRSGMGYVGAKTIFELQEKANFVRITNAGLKESHPHDLGGIKSAPNYHVN